ncbi:helix-turn-helix domain-containing protein [Methylomonas sp. 2BW1-5-20]|uniref:helix-turn-helix domain-containing protein n=1 Tax=Methylomonas sp. 2BW1-5-20 TaxID=3376686 RepID=UPI0040523DAD
MHELKTGKISSEICFDSLDLISAKSDTQETARPLETIATPTSPAIETRQAPLLSAVVDDFLNRYDQTNKATFTKRSATLPLLIELVADKPINQILQTDLNGFCDDVQRLPIKRTKKIYSGMTIREIISANDGRSIAEGTFESTYKACVRQAAEFLHMSPAVLRQKAKAGLVKGAKPGKCWVFLQDDLADYLRSLYLDAGQAPQSGLPREVK